MEHQTLILTQLIHVKTNQPIFPFPPGCAGSSQFSTAEAVLDGTRYMVAMQLAREPLVRHVLRQTFQERAKINTKPTKKGKKVDKDP